MKTISEEYFLKHFIEISEKLTIAELRMLYLLITEPDVIRLSQQVFGHKIKAHRRTINIGLKKLKEFEYIIDTGQDKIEHTDDNISDIQFEQSIKNVPKTELGRIKKFIIESFLMYYNPSNDEIIVINEDFFSFVLRNWRVYKNLRNKKLFITKTILESYSNTIFYYKRDQSSYASEAHYYITNCINNEINRVRESRGSHIKKDKLLQHLYETFSISEDEVLHVLQNDFPNLFIDGNRIKIPKPRMILEKIIENDEQDDL